MARINVNPTRMELTNLKKKLNTSRRGHKLLKDKRDELMRQFMDMVHENERLREEVESGISAANKCFAAASASMEREQLETAFLMPKQQVSLELSEKNVMSVPIPSYRITFRSPRSEDIYPYGYVYTSSELDESVKALSGVFEKMLRLAEVEKSCQLLAAEIEKTRRRVNALEHVMIPQYQETIKYITMKLDENERSTTTRLMKIKDMMLSEAHGYQKDY